MNLLPGTSLGSFDILGSLGSGGMGEVYRARDRKLQREVAIKALPREVAADAERIARFEREAQLLAALHHPNIAGIHELLEHDGHRYLVLELIDGSTLAERIGKRGLPIEDAIPIARQVADALEAAHDQGIVHRDLKPANVKIRGDGVVKVLDFGLARVEAGPAREGGRDSQDSPTMTSPVMTAAGIILGTAAYMSPEQARGKAVDRRTDIWAFGCVLYEMLTGMLAFRGDTVSDTIGAILRDDPDWARLPAETPTSVRKLLTRCLQKDPRQRLPHIGSARFELEETREPDAAAPASRSAAALSRVLWPAIAAVLAVTTIALAIGLARQTPIESQPTVSTLLLPENSRVSPPNRFALSPDGRRLAVVAPGAGGQNVVWVRAIDSVNAQPLAGTEGAVAPFWSPDSRHIAFAADGKLKRIEASGGSVTTLADGAGIGPGSWGRDGTILFPHTQSRSIVRVSSNGGETSPVVRAEADEGTAYFPWFLPDSEHFLYLANRKLYLASLTGREKQLLLADVGNAAVASGHLVFLREATLYARPFDPDRRELLGNAVPLAEGVLVNTGSGAGAFAVSATGVLIYQSARAVLSTLTWFDRNGREAGVLGEAGLYSDVWLSKDGRWVATSMFSGAVADRDIWLIDVQRGLRSRVTRGPSDDTGAMLSPDGSHVVFTSRRGGVKSLQMVAATGQGEATTLAEDVYDKTAHSWTPDGQVLMYTRFGGPSSFDLWTVPTALKGKPSPFIQTAAPEGRGEFSPDGRYVAYEVIESGRSDVHVTTYPDRSRTWPVSAGGGSHPHWRRDGKEIFFVSGTAVMHAGVTPAPGGIEIAPAKPLIELASRFPRSLVPFGGATNLYDVSPDGQRFLFNLPTQTASDYVTLMVNWPQLAATSR